jgi:metal-responsive CopG/Arc/MetJ family transcriptional regulator
MAAETAHIYVSLPVELKREIDALAGPRGRSAFFAAAAEQELRRRKLAALRAAQREDRGCLEDHPYIN